MQVPTPAAGRFPAHNPSNSVSGYNNRGAHRQALRPGPQTSAAAHRPTPSAGVPAVLCNSTYPGYNRKHSSCYHTHIPIRPSANPAKPGPGWLPCGNDRKDRQPPAPYERYRTAASKESAAGSSPAGARHIRPPPPPCAAPGAEPRNHVPEDSHGNNR